MSLTLPTQYTEAANAALKYLGGSFNEAIRYLGRNVTWPDQAAAGVFSMPVWTAMTAGSITDGTPVTNLLNNTYKVFTVAECQATISLTPMQAGGPMLDGANMVKANMAQVESIYLAAFESYIAALIAATPTQSNTLTAGYANFKGATATELGIFANTLVTTAANRNGDCSEFRCFMHPTAYGYFFDAVARLYSSASGFNISSGGLLTVFGCPIIPATAATSTSFGGASTPCAFIVHPEGAPLVLGPVKLHGGGAMYASDATVKWIMTGIYAHDADAQVALTGEILNAAS
jgi:hypothetical protein